MSGLMPLKIAIKINSAAYNKPLDLFYPPNDLAMNAIQGIARST